MTEWGVVLVIITFVGFLITVTTIAVNVSKVIQKNTDSNSSLKEAVDDLKDTLNNVIEKNQEEHNAFTKSINHLKTDVAVLKEKHHKE